MKLFRRNRERRPSMRKKVLLSLGSIAAILLLSGVLSILEYRRMSDYVSEKIAADIKSHITSDNAPIIKRSST